MSYDAEYVRACIVNSSRHVHRAEAKKLLEALRSGFPTTGRVRIAEFADDDPLEAKLVRSDEDGSGRYARLAWDDSALRLRLWTGGTGRDSEDEHEVPLEWGCLGPRWIGRRPNGEVINGTWPVIERMMELLTA
ncbi:MAG: hypothetical protein KC586_16835 [Myxococcales bacterium]|nr:hypothetical protein [Myxococcales bacterium]